MSFTVYKTCSQSQIADIPANSPVRSRSVSPLPKCLRRKPPKTTSSSSLVVIHLTCTAAATTQLWVVSSTTNSHRRIKCSLNWMRVRRPIWRPCNQTSAPRANWNCRLHYRARLWSPFFPTSSVTTRSHQSSSRNQLCAHHPKNMALRSRSWSSDARLPERCRSQWMLRHLWDHSSANLRSLTSAIWMIEWHSGYLLTTNAIRKYQLLTSFTA